MEIRSKSTIVRINEDYYEIEKDGNVWKSIEAFHASITLTNGRNILFENARQKESYAYENDIASALLTRYRDLKGVNFAFDTLVWIEKSSGEVYFEWIPVNDNGFEIKEILWPSPFVLHKGKTLIPSHKGCILESTSSNKWERGNYNGLLCSEDGSMPWLAQIEEDGQAYMIVSETPWDMRYEIKHDTKTPTQIQMCHLPSLGKMHYRRILRYIFMCDSDVSKLCSIYREIAKEKGLSLSKQDNEENLQQMAVKCSKHTCVQNAQGDFDEKHLCDSFVLSYCKKMIKENVLDTKPILLENFASCLKECIHPAHRLTREQSLKEKQKVIAYLNAKGIKVYLDTYVDSYLPFVQFTDKKASTEEISLFDLVYKPTQL